MAEYYGNIDKLTPVVHEVLDKYPQLKYDGLPCADPIRNSCLHFEYLVYPTLLVQFIDFNGPRFADKLVKCDIKTGVDFQSMSETAFTKQKVAEMAAKSAIKIGLNLKTVASLDSWIDARANTAKMEGSSKIFKNRVALALIMISSTRSRFFNHVLMNIYVEERLKALTLLEDNQIAVIDHIMVDAILEANMM